MGERAIAGVQHGDGISWYRSQWGGSNQVLAQVFANEHAPGPLLDVDWDYVADCPHTRPFEDVPSYHLTALYLLTSSKLSVYCPLWFGLGLTSPPVKPDATVFVRVTSLTSFRECRERFRRFKGLLLDYVRMARLTHGEALAVLARAFELVSRLECSVSPDGKLLY